MKIYIIEKGTNAQTSEIFRAYSSLRLALEDMQTLADNYRKEGWEVAPGLDKNTNNMGHALCGFWIRTKEGSGCVQGFRLLEFPVIE